MHSPLLFDLPSVQPLLPLSLGFGCEEASLSLMTVDLLPARPPLCPQLTQLSLETKDQRSGDVSQTDPLRQNNNQQKHFSTMSAMWVRIWRPILLYHLLNVFHFYFIVASGNMAQKKKHEANMDILLHNAHYVLLVFSQKGYGLEFFF